MWDLTPLITINPLLGTLGTLLSINNKLQQPNQQHKTNKKHLGWCGIIISKKIHHTTTDVITF